MLTDLRNRVEAQCRGKTILITGGAGTIGSALAEYLISFDIKAVRLFDNSEERAFFQQMRYRNSDMVRVLLGDIRDRSRLARALQGVDIVIHTAALKHVELGELNPFEVVSTNLTALQSLIELCLDADVERFVFTSSDKAVNPTNVMGGSKFIGERIVTAANTYKGPHRTTLCCTRFGNVLGSAGSVVPVFERQIARNGPITVTEPEMTRFFMTLSESVELVMAALVAGRSGDIFVPKMHAIRLQDLAEAMVEVFSPNRPIRTERVGLRPGEKWYEELITDHEQSRCLETERLLIVQPYLNELNPLRRGAVLDLDVDTYPDSPRWTQSSFSSQSTVPLSRAEVLSLVRKYQSDKLSGGL